MSISFKVGDRIKDVFQVESILEGGMGIVYICRPIDVSEMPDQVKVGNKKEKDRGKEPEDKKQDAKPKWIAMKSFHRELLWHAGVNERFRREAMVWITLLPHPNIIKAQTVDLIGSNLYLWLEYADAGNLRERLLRGPLALEETLSIALQFCHGMEFLFASGPIAHRDIKPENILLMQSGTVKITDFGLAKAISPNDNAPQPSSEAGPDDSPEDHAEGKSEVRQLTRHGAILGTVPYMSPEQFEAKAIDVPSDVYGFGVVLYEMLTGQRPFDAPTFQGYRDQHLKALPVSPEKISSTPVEISRIVLKCLEKKSENRFLNFTTLRESLEEYCRGHDLERIITIAPSLEELERNMEGIDWNFRGYALAKLGDQENAAENYQKSYECYARALELDPDAVSAHVNVGSGLGRLGRFDEALHHFQEAVRIHPDVAILYSPLSHAYLRAGRNDDAIAASRKAAEMDGRGIARWREYGYMCSRLGREDGRREAIEHTKQLLLTVPEYRDAKSANNEAIQWQQAGDLGSAVEMHEFAIEHFPDDPLSWYNFGVTLHRLQQDDGAVTCYSNALQLDPALTFALVNRGLVLARVGQGDQACRDWEAAIQTDPQHFASGLAARLLDIGRLGNIAALASIADIRATLRYID